MRTARHAQRGFSLIELVVALFFTAILMAGFARVFRGSVTTFVGSSEGISALRKNRLAIDLLQNDINQAGMFLAQLSSPPGGLSSSNPPFMIDPGTFTDPESSQTSDTLFLFADEAFPVEPVLTAPAGNTSGVVERSANEIVASGAALPSGLTSTYSVDCKDPVIASQLVTLLTKSTAVNSILNRSDIGHPKGIPSSASKSGNIVTFTAQSKDWDPLGATGQQLFLEGRALVGDQVVITNSRQQFRYRVMLRTTGPGTTAPCLVREQGTYNMTAFTPDESLTTVVAEFVERFKVYLSADNGTTWVGLASPAPSNWAGYTAALSATLASTGRTGAGSDLTNLHWYREIPTLMRVDLTTRTPIKRAEYGTPVGGQPVAAYQRKTQSFVIMPRHFGLPY